MTDHHVSDLVKLGFDAILHGHLAGMRATTGLSKSGMARLIGIDPDAMSHYEECRRTMNHVTALRIGEWFWSARHLLAEEPDFPFGDMIPGPGAAMLMGVNIADLEGVLKQRGMEYEDLGILGLFVYRDQIPSLRVTAAAA